MTNIPDFTNASPGDVYQSIDGRRERVEDHMPHPENVRDRLVTVPFIFERRLGKWTMWVNPKYTKIDG